MLKYEPVIQIIPNLIMYSKIIIQYFKFFSIKDLPRSLELNFFSLVLLHEGVTGSKIFSIPLSNHVFY